MSGIITDDGSNHFVSILFKATSVQDYYLGLMIEGSLISDNITTTALQIGSGITEISGTGYTRQALSRGTDWTISGRTATCSQKTFTVGSGGWSDVKGYFITETLNGSDAIVCESLPSAQQGDRSENDVVKITPSYAQRTFADPAGS